MLALLTVGAAIALGGLWLWVSSGPSDEAPITIAGPTSTAGAANAPDELPLPAGSAVDGPAVADPTEPFDAAEDPLRFEGRGSIRGQVAVDPGTAFPDRYAVVVGPSRHVIGGERATSKRVELPGTAEEFRVDDLPLGGYDIWVEAERMNSLRTPVLLTRTAAHPYVVLKISPTGFIDGYVIHSDGSPAEEVRVTLERTPDKERREAQTRADGLYRFDDVQDGEYRILLGPPDTPLIPARELSFRAPSLRFPDLTLPTTVNIRINTQDHRGKPICGATVSGFGEFGGTIDLVSDGTGVCWARHLPPGSYRVNARAEDGRKARATLELGGTSDQEFWLILR